MKLVRDEPDLPTAYRPTIKQINDQTTAIIKTLRESK